MIGFIYLTKSLVLILLRTAIQTKDLMLEGALEFQIGLLRGNFDCLVRKLETEKHPKSEL